LQRDLGQRRQAIVGGRIQEPEGQVAALDRSGYPPERHPRPFERFHQADPPHIALGEVAVRARGEDPEFDQHDDVVIGDPRAIGHVTDRVLSHMTARLPERWPAASEEPTRRRHAGIRPMCWRFVYQSVRTSCSGRVRRLTLDLLGARDL
jgi:hypothetical protein